MLRIIIIMFNYHVKLFHEYNILEVSIILYCLFSQHYDKGLYILSRRDKNKLI